MRHFALIGASAAILRVTFSRVEAPERLRSLAFYVSRIPSHWLVWRVIA